MFKLVIHNIKIIKSPTKKIKQNKKDKSISKQIKK